jgi:polyisoprenoid-binding protein YceI
MLSLQRSVSGRRFRNPRDSGIRRTYDFVIGTIEATQQAAPEETKGEDAMAATETKTVNGISVPPAGKWEFDRAHTRFGFVARHMLSKVRGQFSEYEGSIDIGENPEDSKIVVELATASITTGNEMRDGHLNSGDFFLTEQYPIVRFASTGIRIGEGNEFEIDGNLTIKDVTNPVTFKAEFLGWGPGLHETTMAAFSAKTTVERGDWDLTWNVPVETGGFLVGKKVDLEIDAEILKAG